MADKQIAVMLVEDNPGDASLLRRMLSAINGLFEITHVTNLSDALQQLRQGGIDVVLLDLGLPDSTGLRTLDQARTQAPDVPIIVITGLSDRDVAVKALSQGAHDFIAKERVDVHLLARAIFRGIGPRDSANSSGQVKP